MMPGKVLITTIRKMIVRSVTALKDVLFKILHDTMEMVHYN